MIRIVLLTMASISSAFAQNSSINLPQALKNLHVNIPASCPLVEKPDAEPNTGGTFLPTTMCKSTTFNTVSRVQAKVYRVVDGDTVHVYIGNVIYGVRMLGMDTPELHFLARAQPKWGMKAKQSLAAMVRGGDTVTLEFDNVKCDKYGRILVHVFKNGTNINYEQIKNGMAANYCIAPNLKYCDIYGDAYAQAKSYQRGIHSDKCSITPYVWRKGMQNLLMDKPVKDRRTGATFAPMDYYKINVEDRIFAAAKSDPVLTH